MYGFPTDLDLKSIIGQDLNLLGLGGYDVQLNFDGSGLKICVQGNLTLKKNGHEITRWDEKMHWSSLDFQQLLNATVAGYRVVHSKLLEIEFADNLVLEIHDNSDQYESLQIYFDDTSLPTIIV